MPLYYFKPDKLGFPQWETKEAIQWLMANAGKKCWADVGRETGIRTGTQNNAMHKGFEIVATTLNAGGLDMRKVLKPEIEIEWTTESVKKYLFKPVMKIMTGKTSTTALGKTDGEIEKIWDTVMRFLGEKHHVDYVPFPSKNAKIKP